MFRKLALLGTIALGVAGCSQFSAQQIQLLQFSGQDAANAASIAAGGGDTIGQACWKSVGAATATGPNLNAQGLMSNGERLRLLDQAVHSQGCSAVIGSAAIAAAALPKPIPVPVPVP